MNISNDPVKSNAWTRWLNFEVFVVNKYLVIAWIVTLAVFIATFFMSSYSNRVLPGITEARQHHINFSQPVIVKEIIVQSGQLVNKGDALFVLQRPDLILKEKENEALLRQAVVEMNIMSGVDHGFADWTKVLSKKKSLKKNRLSPLELKFLSLMELDNYIKSEKSKLMVTSPVSGHAGEVILNPGETVSPYTNIISLYQSQPSFVKSYIPESFDLAKFNQSRTSIIRSMSRDIQVAGKVVAIGTILTELPQRFQKDPMNKLFGREIKIELPKDNGLYLGEKVYVSVEDQ